jgi:gliding motility-associated-like protein
MDNNTNVGTLTLTRTSIVDITKTCKKETSKCQQPCTTSYPYGIEKHVFEGTLDLRAAMRNGCCRFELFVQLFVRNVAITTGQSQQTFYTFAEMDACAKPCNSSPSLTNDPVAILCCNQPYYFNNGATDTSNFDSLSYSFATAYQNRGQSNSYTGVRTPQNPISAYYPSPLKFPQSNPNANPPIGIYVDAETGDIIFTPVDCNQVTVVVMQMDEWRKDKNGKYQNIGITRRDMQFIVTQCPDNNPPIITNSKFSYSTCEGEQICFNITTDDKTFSPPPPAKAPDPDTVLLAWNRGIPGATFKITNKGALHETGQFCWTPPVGFANSLPYTFTATATDNACPKNASTTRSFRVFVKPKALAKRIIKPEGCGRYSVESVLYPNFRGTAEYSWLVMDENSNIITDRKKVHFKSTGIYLSLIAKDTIQFKTGGRYIVQHRINSLPDNCPTVYEDTIDVPALLEVDLTIGNDTFVCRGVSLRVPSYIKNASGNITYRWATPVDHNPKDTLSYLDVMATGDTSVSVLIKDATGCTAWDTVQIFLRENPKVDLGPDLRICAYNSIVVIPKIDTARMKTNDTTWVVQGSSFVYEWLLNGNTFSGDTVLKTSYKGTYNLNIYDSLGCKASDALILYVNDTVRAIAGSDQIICWNDTLILTALGLDTVGNGKKGTYRWWDITISAPAKVLKGTASVLKFPLKTSTDYWLELYVTEDTTTCYSQDTTKIFVNALPVITMPDDQSICCDAGDINMYFLTPNPGPLGGNWYCSLFPEATNASGIFNTSKVCDTVRRSVYLTYCYTNPVTGCTACDSFRITVNPLPKIDIKQGTYCQDVGKVRLQNHLNSPKNPNAGQFNQWKCVDCRGFNEAVIIKNESGSAFYTDYYLYVDKVSMPMGNRSEDTIKLEFIFRDNAGCWGRDTTSFRIVKVPVITFTGFPNLCWDRGAVDLISLSNVTPNDGIWKCADSTKCFSTGALTGSILDTRKTNPAGATYDMRYLHTASGCPIWKDTILVINPLPIISLTKLPALLCKSDPEITMSAFPQGGVWTSDRPGSISGNRFTPNSAPAGVSIKVKYTYTHPLTGCIGSDSMIIRVEALPEVEVLTSDLDTCRSPQMTIGVSARMANTNGLTWTALTPGTNLSSTTGTSLNWSFSTSADSSETLLLYVQTQTGNACPFVDDLFTVRVHPKPKLTVMPDDPDGCNPHNVLFTTSFNNKVDPNTSTYSWDFGDGSNSSVQNPVHIFTKDGSNSVSLKVTSEQGCYTTVSLNIDVYPLPDAAFTPNPNNYTTAALPKFKFFNESKVSGVLNSFIQSYAWDFGHPAKDDDTSSMISPLFFYPGDTANYEVWLKVTTNQGCVDSTKRLVIIGPDVLVYIPNAFTPGEGGPQKNDVFNVVSSGYDQFELNIYNRWGELLFVSNKVEYGWDGKYNGQLCQQDVYVYVVTVTSLDKKVYTFTGNIHLLR